MSGASGASSSRRQKANLNRFGQAYYQLCGWIGVNGTQLAIASGIDPGTISRTTRDMPGRPTTRIERKTIEKLYATMQKKALAAGVAWDHDLIWPHLLRVAGYSTEDDQAEGFNVLSDYLEQERRNPPEPGGT